jgi:amphi-Trp domain-containing protein
MKKKTRDITKTYPIKQFVQKIRRFADGLETKEPFVIQIAGEKIRVPKGAKVNIEHERSKEGEEIEFQIVWKNETVNKN